MSRAQDYGYVHVRDDESGWDGEEHGLVVLDDFVHEIGAEVHEIVDKVRHVAGELNRVLQLRLKRV